MKKILSKLLLFIIILEVLMMSVACARKTTEEETFDYESLYVSSAKEPFGIVDKTATIRASHGYTLKSGQGYNGWYYLYGEDNSEMIFDKSTQKWQGEGASMNNEYMRPTVSQKATRKYVTDCGGKATIYGNYKCENEKNENALVFVLLNSEQIYAGELSSGDTIGKYFEISVDLKAGDEIYFSVQGETSVSFNPVISFKDAQKTSLYHKTDIGECYGDVFPYYDFENKKLYMGFLWTKDAGNNNYKNALELSENMLEFENIPEANNYDVWDKYKRNYRIEWRFDCNNFIDRNKYSFGIRDHMLYFDKANNRYLLIASCYYSFNDTSQISDFVIYESDDPNAFSWTKAANPIALNYNKNLPECPSLMKINDRWYSFVSVAYKTAHQVGQLQYWTGEKNVDCMDDDWINKEFAFLDGEDLCAARPTQVGDKVYMWGWIPERYDTMPWSPWGGYLNLPREVVQRADGSLGGRLDPALSKIVNYGNIYTPNDNNFLIEQGTAEFSDNKFSLKGENNYISLGKNYNRNYVTFNLNLKNSGSGGYVMKQDGKEYRVVVVKENGNTYLKVLSPDDSSHKINSFIEIKNADNYNIKIVNDGEFIEFFVNDEYALTAHTAMNGELHESFIFSDKSAEFSNIKINKLIPYGEL